MRVLHIRSSEFYGGPERQLHLHARELKQGPVEITIASFAESGTAPDFLNRIAADGIHTHLFPVRSPYDLKAVKTVGSYLREQRVDVLCTHDYRSDVVGWLARQGSQSRWIAFSRGFTRTNLKIRTYQAIDSLLVRRADLVVAVSQAQAEKLLRRGLEGSRLAVVRNAIDPRQLMRSTPVDLRARFGFPATAIIGVAAGRFSAEKGQDVLIRAAIRAIVQCPDLRVVLFGSGPGLDPARRVVREEGLQNMVFCPGFEGDIAGCLQGADFLINPSYSEGLPNIVLEGMALGLPVVATAVGGVPEIIDDGRTGILIPPGDDEALCRALIRCCENLEGVAPIGLRGREFVETHCTFAEQSRALVELYRDLI